MAANKFATMLHKNTNKITMILIYAILEWTLIILLLLNSFFSYMIIKFAEYFGLKRPCPLCSRVDHVFEHEKNKSFRRDLLCEAHITELSKLGYCSNHQKLVESQDMCEDCSSSSHDIREVLEDSEVNMKCSCCGVNVERKFSNPNNCILIKPCFDDLGNIQKGNLVVESIDDDLDKERSDFCEERIDLSDGECLVFQRAMKDQGVQACVIEDSSFEFSPQHLDFFIECSGHKLVPVELIDSITEEDHCENQAMRENHIKNEDEVSLSSEEQVNEEVEVVVENKIEEEPKFAVLDSMEMEEDENGFGFCVEECHSVKDVDEHFDNTQLQQALARDNVQIEAASVKEEKGSDVAPVSEEVFQIPRINETEAEVLIIGSEIPVMNLSDEIPCQGSPNSSTREELSTSSAHFHEIDQHGPKEDQEKLVQLKLLPVEFFEHVMNKQSSVSSKLDEIEVEKVPEKPCQGYSCIHEEPSTSSVHFHEIVIHGPKEDQEKLVQLKLLSVEFDENVMNKQSSISSKLDEIEEEKVPETPTSIDSFHQLHKKLLLFEKKDFGTESLDGSVVSELEGGDAVSSIEHLKSALKAERKALHALYTELEEERSASAVAANQTMAMINKLQEEKSAMQMEALQYQRMMEEQSEYDQEALQLLNELMVKREKEKQELEKELEVYRKRLSEYEAKEKAMRMLKRSKDGSVARSGFSSASYSNGEDSEEVSIDLNQEPKEYDNFYCHQECEDHKVQVDAVQELEESFVDFEEERMSILVQLKMLEEKLITMDDEDAKELENVRPTDDVYRENGHHTEDNSHLDGEINEHANGFLSEMNGKHHQQKIIVNAEGKGLLPLFDAISDENGDVMINGHENGFHANGVDEENKKLDVEDELDHLHERLQALEADREFLKNCISSLKKGDKGMDLLHEILQHLRDLKNVDLRVRSSCNSLMS